MTDPSGGQVTEEIARGDPIPPNCYVIEVRVAELKQLFNAIDPSPFNDRDLDPNAVEFILRWAREASRDAQLALRVHLDRVAGVPDEAAILREAVHEYFANRALSTRSRLRLLFRRGRTSLVIGLAFLTTALLAADFLSTHPQTNRFLAILRESLLIGGWVAMWRPLEVFLYDWWPIRAEARLFDRLAKMPVRIRYRQEGAPDTWRSDWPVTPIDSTAQRR